MFSAQQLIILLAYAFLSMLWVQLNYNLLRKFMQFILILKKGQELLNEDNKDIICDMNTSLDI